MVLACSAGPAFAQDPNAPPRLEDLIPDSAVEDPEAWAEVEDTPEETEAAIARGVFGAPSYVYKDEIFWGQDRLDFLDRALAEG